MTSGARVMPRLVRVDSAQAAFEFMLMLPIFILFFLLLVDLGMLMYQYVSVSNAVREGARYASVNCPAAPDPGCQETLLLHEVRDRVVARSGGILATTDTFEVSWVDTVAPTATSLSSPGRADRGDTVVVKVTHSYPFMFFPGVSVPVISCANMQLELQDQGSIPATTITGC